jgi:hypothetical protein
MPQSTDHYTSEAGKMWAGLLFIVFGFAWAMSGVWLIVDSYFKSVDHTNRVLTETRTQVIEEIRSLRTEVKGFCEAQKLFGKTCDAEFDRLDTVSDTVGAHELEIKRLKERQSSFVKQREQ